MASREPFEAEDLFTEKRQEEPKVSEGGWIGIDLDGTLAFYDNEWRGPDHIGEPIPAMIERVKEWIATGVQVRIFTARVWGQEEGSYTHKAIEGWCEKNLGVILPITCQKDYGMIELWDDRCVQVEMNNGRRVDGKS